MVLKLAFIINCAVALHPTARSFKLRSGWPLARMRTVTASAAGPDTDDEFIAGLRGRMAETKAAGATIPLLVLDAMLPLQRLSLQLGEGALGVFNATLEASDNAATTAVPGAEGRSFGMLGIDPRTRTPIQFGTAVEVGELWAWEEDSFHGYVGVAGFVLPSSNSKSN